MEFGVLVRLATSDKSEEAGVVDELDVESWLTDQLHNNIGVTVLEVDVDVAKE